MARFNTQQSTISITGETTLTYVIDKSTLLLTGTAGYTVTLANPSAFPGSSQHIYNATGGNVTIAIGSGTLIGNGFTSAASQVIPNNTTYSVTSDGTNYVITNNQGGPISVTSGTFSGPLTANSTVSLNPANANVTVSPTGTGTVTINSASAGSINNMSIGASTRGAGNFTSLDANSTVGLSPSNANVTVSPSGTGTVTVNPATAGSINNMSIGASTRGSGAFTTLAANNAVTLTANTTSTNTTSGTLVVTGGVGVSGAINAGGNIGTSGTGTFSGGINSTSIGASTRSSGAFTSLAANNGLSVTGGSISVDAAVSTTFSGSVSVPNPTADGHAANRNYVLNRVIWTTNSSLGTVDASSHTGPYSFSVSATTVSGTAAVTYAYQSGTLPPGGSVASNGTISGTSNAGAGTSNSYTFTIRATASGIFEDRQFTVTIAIPVAPGQVLYEGSATNTNGGSQYFTWTAPAGVNSVSIAAIGGGGGGYYGWAVCGGAGGGLVWANGVPVTPGGSYTIAAGNGGCWSQSMGGCSCFPGFLARGGACGCCPGCYAISGSYSQACGGWGTVAYPNTAGGGGGGGGYGNNQCFYSNSGYTGCYGGGGSATSHHSSTYGTGGGGGTGIYGQGANGACGNAGYSHQTGSGGQGGSGGTCGKPGEPWSNGQGHGYSCGGNYGGGGGGGGTSHGGGWGGKGAVRILWGGGRSYPSNAADM